MNGLEALIDAELERRLVGTLLTGGKQLDAIAPTDLHGHSLGRALMVAQDLHREGKQIEPVVVLSAAHKRGALTKEQADLLVMDLTLDPGEQIQAIDSAAEQIRSLARLRRLREGLMLAVANCEKGDEDSARSIASTALDGAESASLSVPRGSGRDAVKSVVAAVRDALDGTRSRIGLRDQWLQQHVGGLSAGDMMVIGGYTGAGKSSVMLYLASKMALSGTTVGVISLEDSQEIWGSRIVSHYSPINGSEILRMDGEYYARAIEDYRKAHPEDPDLSGCVQYQDVARMLGAATKAAGQPGLDALRISYPIGGEADGIVREATHLIRNEGCRVLFVDYLQAVRVSSQNRYDKAVGDVAKRLKGLCAKLGAAMILGSQLNIRQKEGGKVPEPGIGSLKETGDVENESEVILLLWPESDGEVEFISSGDIDFCKEFDPCRRKPFVRAKIGKVKWGGAGPKAVIGRDPHTGAVTGFPSALAVAENPLAHGYGLPRSRA